MALEGLDEHESVRAARAMYRRVVAAWALDALNLRSKGWDRVGRGPSAASERLWKPATPTGARRAWTRAA